MSISNYQDNNDNDTIFVLFKPFDKETESIPKARILKDFGKFGEIKQLRRNPNNIHNFFISFQDTRAAKNAIETWNNKIYILEGTLVVAYARRRNNTRQYNNQYNENDNNQYNNNNNQYNNNNNQYNNNDGDGEIEELMRQYIRENPNFLEQLNKEFKPQSASNKIDGEALANLANVLKNINKDNTKKK